MGLENKLTCVFNILYNIISNPCSQQHYGGIEGRYSHFNTYNTQNGDAKYQPNFITHERAMNETTTTTRLNQDAPQTWKLESPFGGKMDVNSLALHELLSWIRIYLCALPLFLNLRV